MMYRLFLLLLAILVIFILFIPTIYGEPRTFNTCYADIAANLLYISMFSPTIINLNDPQMKIYITNYCNFYHEKLGVWLDTSDAPKFSEMTDQDIILSREF